MRWRKLERSDNVQDRRGASAGKVAGGVGGLGIIGVLLALFLGGGGGGLTDALQGLGAGGGTATQTEQAQPPEYAGLDDVEDFIRAILGSTETVWTDVFANSGRTYQPAALVLFTDFTDSACGGANSQVGPHYCPVDKTIYIDRGFYAELERFGATGGDFAEAYVVAHEVAHHVQNELGVMDEVRSAQQSDPNNRNAYSVSLELQADCLAGVWANYIFTLGDVLERGDIEEALNAAAAVGDDRIQEVTQDGQINPETWTHGSSQERVDWFTTGYQTGDASQCNTF